MMPNLSPLSTSSDPDGEGMVGVTVVLRLSAQSTVHSRYFTVYSLQRKGEVWCVFSEFLVLVLVNFRFLPFRAVFNII